MVRLIRRWGKWDGRDGMGWMRVGDGDADGWDGRKGMGWVPKRNPSYWVRVSGDATGISGFGGAYIFCNTSSDNVSGTLHTSASIPIDPPKERTNNSDGTIGFDEMGWDVGMEEHIG